MTENNSSKDYLEGIFENLAGNLETSLAHEEDDGSIAKPPRINDGQLVADIGETSPIALFIKNTRLACPTLLAPPKPSSGNQPGGDDRSTVERNAEFLAEVHARIKGTTGSMSRSKEVKLAEALKADPRFSDLPTADDFLQFTRLTDLQQATAQLINQRSLQTSTQQALSQLGAVNAISAQNPTPADWDALKKAVEPKIKAKPCASSLIYSYWLDEGGLHFALERIADRVENGIVNTTEALRTLHIHDSSPLVEALSSLIVSWQRGEMFDVDARRKQYHALYGFPLQAARAWGGIATVDPRPVFVRAFHGFLYEASRYYDSQRDLQKLPDIEAARSALGQMIDALREGNENLRLRRTSQIRGQSEYCKRLLGGSVQGTPFADEWTKYLTGRPGVNEASDTKPWQVKVDAVASAYGWTRPRMKDYVALAESGETLLVATRVGGEAGAGGNEGVTKAFLALLQPHVLRYVNAFKVVGGVDLGQKLMAAPPAAMLARQPRQMPIPPLKRDWAARTPAASRNSAA